VAPEVLATSVIAKAANAVWPNRQTAKAATHIENLISFAPISLLAAHQKKHPGVRGANR
jgi:hypothetical protein